MQMFENPARPLTREGFVFKRPGDSPGGHVMQQTYIQLNYNHTALPLLSKVVAPTGPKVNTHSAAPNFNPYVPPSKHAELKAVAECGFVMCVARFGEMSANQALTQKRENT